jgi:Na+-driven multidrug efflux pump
MVSMAICGGLIWFFRHQLFALIGPEVSSEGVAGGFSYLAVIVPVYPLLAVSFVISRALNGAGSVRTPLAIDLLLFIVLALPISALASGAGLFGMGVREVTNPLAVWWTCSILHVIAALAYGVVWWMGRWRRKRLVGGSDADDDAVLT